MGGSRMEYAQRMHRVQEYIDAHLDGRLDLETLAEVANFSAFHFHRLFSAWMGETLGDYLRRRRLEMAAVRLAASPDEPVLNIALSVGFGSAEAFARAFKQRFGCTASVWRRQEVERRVARNSNPGQSLRNPNQELTRAGGKHGASSKQGLEAPMEVKVIDREPTKVVYMRYVGPYGEPISRFWRDTVAPWMGTHGLFGRPRFGVCHDDPGITVAKKCRYDACIEAPEGFVVSGKALATVLPGGKYAVTSFFGVSKDIGHVWEELLRDWLPASGMQLDARPFLEHYPVDARYEPESGKFGCDICVPVASL